MLGNKNSTAYLRCTDVLVFPDYGHNVRPPLCRRPGCKRCASSAEAATVHSDCLELFTRELRLKDGALVGEKEEFLCLVNARDLREIKQNVQWGKEIPAARAQLTLGMAKEASNY